MQVGLKIWNGCHSPACPALSRRNNRGTKGFILACGRESLPAGMHQDWRKGLVGLRRETNLPDNHPAAKAAAPPYQGGEHWRRQSENDGQAPDSGGTTHAAIRRFNVDAKSQRRSVTLRRQKVCCLLLSA